MIAKWGWLLLPVLLGMLETPAILAVLPLQRPETPIKTLGRARQLERDGDASSENKDYAKARSAYEQSFRLYEATDTPAADCAHKLGRVYRRLHEFERAIAFAERALDGHRKQDNLEAAALDLTLMADIEVARRNWDGARRLAEEALHLSRNAESRRGMAEAFATLSLMYTLRSQHDEALHAARERLRVEEEIGDPQRILSGLDWLRRVQKTVGDYRAVLDLSHRILKLVAEIAGPAELIEETVSTGTYYWHLAEYRTAAEYYERAWQLSEEIGDGRGLMRSLHNLGLLHFLRGDYTRALDYYQRSLTQLEELERRAPQTYFRAQVLLNIGALHEAVGDSRKALQHYQNAVPLYESVAMADGVALSLTKIGSLLADQDDLPQALFSLQKALDIRRKSGDQWGLAGTYRKIGAVSGVAGDHAKALDYLQESLRIAHRLDDKGLTAHILSDLGFLHHQRGHLPAARESLGRSIQLSREIGQRESLWASLYRLALVSRAAGETEQAAAQLREAIGEIENIRGTIPSADQRAGFFQDKVAVYQQLITLLAAAHRNRPDPALLGQAFDYAERKKARTVLDLLVEARSDVAVREGLAADLREAEQDLLARISEIQTQLRDPGLTPSGRDALKEELTSREEEYSELKLTIKIRDPAYAGLIYPESLTLAQVQSQLPSDDVVLLEYALGLEESYLFAVSRHAFRVYALTAREEIERLVTRYRQLTAGPEGSLQELTEVAHRLYRLLIQPAEQQLQGKKHLILVPDGLLHYLPFEGLLAGSGELDYLVRDYAISYLPSASTLEHLTRQEPVRTTEHELLAFGDPLQPTADGTTPPVSSSRTVRGWWESSRYSFSPLPHSREEIQSIRSVLGRSRVFLGADATEENLKQSVQNSFPILHFATHAIPDEEVPARSAIGLQRQIENLPHLQKSVLRRVFIECQHRGLLCMPALLPFCPACGTSTMNQPHASWVAFIFIYGREIPRARP